MLYIICGLTLRFVQANRPSTAISFAASIAFINLFLGLFNLMPFPPLDGFTALRSALPWHLASVLNRLEQQIRSMGILSLILFLFMFSLILSGPFISFVAWVFRLIIGGA